MKIKDHLRNIRESLNVLKESVRKGLQERQRNIGFNTSTSAVEMLEVFLHEKDLINPCTIIKHGWFNSKKKAYEKLNFDFPKKKEIINLICQIEEKRNLLCYGKPRPIESVESVLKSFYELKSLFEKLELKWN